MSRRQFLALIVPLLLVLIGFVAIAVLERSGAVGSPPWDADFARYVRTTLAYEFVGGVNDEREAWEAYFSGLNAYVRYFDNYAEVVPPWMLEDSREESSGQYGGIGVRTQAPADDKKPREHVEIIGVKPTGPADKAGLEVGDAIIAVEGRTVLDITTEGGANLLANVIKGERGTKVKLRVRAPDGKEREADVLRDRIDTSSVVGTRLVDDEARIGYVRIDRFVMNTAQSFKEAVEKLLEQKATGLVLDLRGNRGGLLPQAVDVADALIDRGILVRVRGRDGEFDDTIRATKKATVTASLPLMVLVDGGSASASEILAGALQDHRRGVIVGERSWGKFLVQTVEEVPMEKGVALFKRTAAIYETPLGHNYQRRHRVRNDPLAGIPPDIAVATTKEDREALRDIFEHDIYADWNPDRKPPVAKDFTDRALAAAVAVLKGETYYPRLPTKQ